MILLIVAIVVALVLFSMLRWMAGPVILFVLVVLGYQWLQNHGIVSPPAAAQVEQTNR